MMSSMKESDRAFLPKNLLDVTMGESDWAFLPKNLLDMILDKLVSFSEYVRFGAVCKPWHSVVMDNKLKFIQNKFLRQVPFLMVPSKDNSDERRSLYSIPHNKVFDFQLRVPYQKRLSGSSHGWLFTVKETFGITLINPFSGATIELPPIMDLSYFHPPDESGDSGDDNDDDKDPILVDDDDDDKDPILVDDDDDDKDPILVDFEVVKATLSADPALYPNDYIVTATYGGYRRLAFILPGDKAWTYIDERFKLIYDVVYYKALIFAVDFRSRVLMIDVNRRDGKSQAPQVKVIAPQTDDYSQRTYLVESSSGDLLIVQRSFEVGDDLQHATSGFKVFKLLLEQLEQFEHGWPMRVEVKNLGGDTLFLGDNQSICVSASKWPGCQPDSIYYTDDYIEILAHPPHGRRDIGIFNIESGRFGTHYILDPSHKDMPPSIWIVPTVLDN